VSVSLWAVDFAKHRENCGMRLRGPAGFSESGASSAIWRLPEAALLAIVEELSGLL
jgi:hypothetical protein